MRYLDKKKSKDHITLAPTLTYHSDTPTLAQRKLKFRSHEELDAILIERAREIVQPSPSPVSSSGGSNQTEPRISKKAEKSVIKSKLEKILESNLLNKNNVEAIDKEGGIEEIIKKIIKSQTLSIKDRKFQTKTYRYCFVGKELVDWLIVANIVPSRTEAINLANRMISLGLIESVLKEHPQFKDDFLYYRFLKHEFPPKKIGINKNDQKKSYQ